MARAAPSPSAHGATISLASEVKPKPAISAYIFAPRCNACSSDSKIKMPPPSATTKPSRSRSHGRLALSGSSFRVDNVLAEANPAIHNELIGASVQPANMTPASPRWIRRKASPIEWEEVAQAVTVQEFGPLALFNMEIQPAA